MTPFQFCRECNADGSEMQKPPSTMFRIRKVVLGGGLRIYFFSPEKESAMRMSFGSKSVMVNG